MADNKQSEAIASPGANWVTAQGSFADDTADVPGCFGIIVTGSEGSRVFNVVVGGAGAVSAGVQRMTLASDDPAVVALQIIDDWDSSDRCKVSPIASQNGVAGGSGTVDATTQRVVLATDVALPTGTNSIGQVTANAGTNLNTSALALESGGNLAAAATSLATLDNIVSGNEAQVDIVAALPAGTNNIGDVDVLSIAAGDNNIGNVDIVTVPTDPFGANADAASATGSISAKLRFIASTGIPITGTVTVGSHAVTNAGTFVVQVDGTALTRLTDIETNTDSLAQVGGGVEAAALRVTIASDSTGVLSVDDNGASLTVDGTVAATQSGTWNVGTVTTVTTVSTLTNITNWGNVVDDAAFTPGTTRVLMAGFEYDDSTPDLVDEGDAGAARMSSRREIYVQLRDAAGNERGLNIDGSGFLTANINGTVTVGSHAVTNAGTFAVQVDGSALTALQLIDNIVHVDDAAFTLGTSSGVMMMGFAGTQSVDANDACALACTTAGHQYVTVASGGIASGAVASGAYASGAFASGAFASGSVASGAFASGSIASGAIADMLVDDAAFTPATSRVMPIGFQADESSTDSVDEGDVGCPRMTLARQQLVVNQAHTNGGTLPLKVLDSDESEDEIKGSAGQLYDLYCFNSTNAILYVKLYNATAANVTVGTTTPVLTIPVPANNDTDGAGVTLRWPTGLVFDTAITIATTTGLADNDTGAPGANAMTLAGSYK